MKPMSIFSSTPGKVLGVTLGGIFLWGVASVLLKKSAAASSSKTMTVTAPSGLFLRANPSQQADRVALLTYGEAVTVVTQNIPGDGLTGGWTKVAVDGKTGYVSSDWISDAQISSSPLPTPAPGATPANSVPGSAPSDPGAPGNGAAPPSPPLAPPPMASSPAYLTDPMVLVPGKHYRARLALNSFMEKAAPRDTLASTFAGIGFSNVQAYMAPNELPADWPAEMAGPAPGAGKTAWVEGDFQGQTAQRVDKPSQIDRAWT